MEIPREIFSKSVAWNKPPFDKNLSIDKRFVSVFILALTDENQLINDEIPEEVVQFVQSK